MIYPGLGLAEVASVKTDQAGEQMYALRLENARILIPCANAALIGLRPPALRVEALRVLEFLSGRRAGTSEPWRRRYGVYLEKLQAGTLAGAAEVMKHIMENAALPMDGAERQLFERAQRLVVNEIAHVLQLSRDAAAGEVSRALGRPLLERAN